MAYNNSKGPRGFGDIKNEDDVDTQIDFGSDSIGFKTNNITRFTISNTSLSCSQYTPISTFKITGNGGTAANHISISSSATELAEGIGFTGSVGFSGSNFGPECKVSFHLPTATDSYLEFTEMTAPGNPASNIGRLYSADDSGTTKLYFKDSAGTTTNLMAGGLSQANQGNNRVITSVDATNINAEANLTFDGNTLKAVGQITSSLGLGALSGSFQEGVAVGGSTIISADKDITNVRSLTASTNIYAANGYFTGILDVEGNVVLGNAASDVINVSGSLTASQGLSVNVDDYPIVLGAAADLSIKHDGSISLIQNKTGHIVVDNTATAKDIRFILGSDSADTEAVKIRNNSGANKWICDAAGNVSGSGTLQAVGNTFVGGTLHVSGALSSSAALGGLSLTIGGAGNRGFDEDAGLSVNGVNNNSAGISNAGSIAGATTISGSGAVSGFTGTFEGGLTVGGSVVITEDKVLQNVTTNFSALSASGGVAGLTLTIGGAGNRGFDEDAQLSVNSINANSQGISNAGAIAGASTISGSGAISGLTVTAEGGFKVLSTTVITEDKELRTRQPSVTRHAYNVGSSGQRWIPFYNVSDLSFGSADETSQMVAPADGRIKRIIFRPTNEQSGGTTRISLYKAVNATFATATHVEHVDVTCSGNASTSNVFNFSGSAHFSAGDVVGITIDPENTPGDVNVVCIWEYDMTGL
tara:strand:+ start:393 stop:2495 length:2103 start_codon:yes stop_codon:yes gene_type:complete